MSDFDKKIVDFIFKKYKKYYDNEIQGCCPIIADTIQKIIGDEIVCDYLSFNVGKREHWWVEKKEIVYDPMGEEYINEPGFRRIEIHRDLIEINKILPLFEQYRILINEEEISYED